MDERQNVVAQHPMIIPPFQDGEAPNPLVRGPFSNHPANGPVIFCLKGSAPVVAVIVKACGDPYDIGFAMIHFSLDFRQILRSVSCGNVVNSNMRTFAENAHGPIPEMKIDIQDIRTLDLPGSSEAFQCDGHVVEVTKSPRTGRGSVMAGWADEPEAGLLHADFGSLDSAAGRQGRQVVDARRLDSLDVAF